MTIIAKELSWMLKKWHKYIMWIHQLETDTNVKSPENNRIDISCTFIVWFLHYLDGLNGMIVKI